MSHAPICQECGCVDCERQAFIDRKPEWVGDDNATYARLVRECVERAADLGARYAYVLGEILTFGKFECENPNENGKCRGALCTPCFCRALVGAVRERSESAKARR